MNSPNLIESEKVIGLKLRLIAAAWFALAATVPVIFFLRFLGIWFFAPGGDSGTLWLYTGVPISAAALSGFLFGGKLLDLLSIEKPAQAALRGLKVSFIAYLIFVSVISIIISFSNGKSFGESLAVIFIIFLYFGFLGLLIVGWLIAIVGSLAGWALFRLSQFSFFEAWLLDSSKISKNAFRKIAFVSVIIFLASLSPAAIINYNSEQARIAQVKKEDTESQLIWAAADGSADKLESLLAQGADANLKDNAGTSLLILAARNKQWKAVETLLIHKADPNVFEESGMSPLMWAASGKDFNMVKILIAYGADVNLANKDGYTPLMYAAMAENGRIVSYLARRGANINARNTQNGTTALSAVLAQRQRSKRWNMENASNKPSQIDIGDNSGIDVVEFLMNHGGVE